MQLVKLFELAEYLNLDGQNLGISDPALNPSNIQSLVYYNIAKYTYRPDRAACLHLQ